MQVFGRDVVGEEDLLVHAMQVVVLLPFGDVVQRAELAAGARDVPAPVADQLRGAQLGVARERREDVLGVEVGDLGIQARGGPLEMLAVLFRAAGI